MNAEAGGTSGGSGGGSSNIDNMSFDEILAIAESDKAKVTRARQQAEGVRLLESVLSDMNTVIGKNTKTLKDNYSTPADGAMYGGIESMLPSLESASSSAKYTAEELDKAAEEAEAAHERVMKYSSEMDSLNKTTPEELKQFADPATGEDGYTVLHRDITSDTREAFRPSDEIYSSGGISMQSFTPDDYTGPEWTGPEPQTPLDETHYDHYVDYGRGGRTTSGGDGSDGGPYGSGGGSTTTPAPDTSTTDNGPDLQTPVSNAPGGTPPPVNTAPSGFSNGPAGGTSPPAMLPGTTPGAGSAKPVAPPATRPAGTGTYPNARSTPGITRPTNAAGGTRPATTPTTGRPASNSNRSLLPNQRQAAGGRNPVSGSGRTPANGTGSARGSRANPRRVATAKNGRSVPVGTRGGVMRGKPNAGFEETLYRNTRTGRTVPSVIGSRQTSEPQTKLGNSRTAAPRAGAAGRVVGERPNKGRQQPRKPVPQSGSLTNTTAKAKKDTTHTWQRSKPTQSTELPSGSIAMARVVGARPSTKAELERAALSKRRVERRELWRRQETGEAAPIPESDLFGGTEGKVTRSVITGARPAPPVTRKEAGPHFSTYGYDE